MSKDGGRSVEGRGRTDARLDLAIDRAVREMLDVEPSAGLRGRVMGRIDALSTNSVASAFRRKLAWIALPIAAGAVIVLAVLAPWRQTTPQAGPSASPAMAAVKPAPVLPPVTAQTTEPVRTTSNPGPSAAPPGPPPSARGAEEHLVVAAVVADDDDNRRIGPLAPIPLITVAGTHPTDIATKEIAVSPLAPLAELQIAPLSPPDRRN